MVQTVQGEFWVRETQKGGTSKYCNSLKIVLQAEIQKYRRGETVSKIAVQAARRNTGRGRQQCKQIAEIQETQKYRNKEIQKYRNIEIQRRKKGNLQML